MTAQITKWLAVDANNDPVALANVYFYDEGTSTPRDAYTSADLTTLHPVPLQADGNGVVPAAWFAGTTGVAVDAKDPDTGASLPLFPYDPAPTIAIGTSGADTTSFTPTTEIAETNVQAAIERVAQLVVVSDNDTTPAPLLNKMAAGTGLLLTETNDGSDETATYAADIIGNGTKLVSADAAGSSGQFAQFDANGKIIGADVSAGITAGSVIATTSGSSVELTTAIPATATEVYVHLLGVSMNGANDDFEIQLGDSGGYETSSYTSYAAYGSSTTSSTSGLVLLASLAALEIRGIYHLQMIDTNRWAGAFFGGAQATYDSYIANGEKTLSDALTSIRLNRVGSTDSFDAGAAVVTWR